MFLNTLHYIIIIHFAWQRYRIFFHYTNKSNDASYTEFTYNNQSLLNGIYDYSGLYCNVSYNSDKKVSGIVKKGKLNISHNETTTNPTEIKESEIAFEYRTITTVVKDLIKEIGVIYRFDEQGRTIDAYEYLTNNNDASQRDEITATDIRSYEVKYNNTLLTLSYADGKYSSRTAAYANGHTSTVNYDNRGNPTSRKLDGNTVSSATYDARGNILELLDNYKNVCYYYTYDKNGNIIKVEEKLGTVLKDRNTFSYDAQDRLISRSELSTGFSYETVYEKNFNDNIYPDEAVKGVKLINKYTDEISRDTLFGGLIGSAAGLAAPYIASFAASSFTLSFPTGFALAGGGTAVIAATITGAQILEGVAALGLGILMFSRPNSGRIRFSDSTGKDPRTGKEFTDKKEAYEYYKNHVTDPLEKQKWKQWFKSKGWRKNHLL